MGNDFSELINLVSQVTGEQLGDELSPEDAAHIIKEFYENIISLLPGHVYWMNKQGVYLGCNDQQAQSAGLSSRQEIVGKTNSELPWNYNSKMLVRMIDEANQTVMETGSIISLEEPGMLPDGSEATYLSTKVPLHGTDGSVTGLVGISIDITDRKRVQRLEQRNAIVSEKLETMGSVSSDIAHELRTPLRTIQLCTASIEKSLGSLLSAYTLAKEKGLVVDSLSERKLKALHDATADIQSEIHSAFTTINMLLMNSDSSKLKSLEKVKLSVVNSIDEALTRYPFEEGERDLVDWQYKRDFVYMGNEDLMVHVLFNLIKNSLYYIKAAGKGRIAITLSDDSDSNQIIFQDTAKGIPSKDLPKVFERFFTTTQHGAGVGLHFCSNVIQEFGGDIACNSVEGKSTTFVISLPKVNAQ